MLNDRKDLTSGSTAMARVLSRFRKDEDGAMIIFSLFMFVMILWLGGMSVDLMRFETTRAKLQGTLDRATLAAADLDQTQPPAEVVKDYFRKAGMIDFLDGEPYVEQGLNYRIVSAAAEAEMPLMFYDIPRVFTQPFNPGLTALTVSGTSSAEERVTDVEVSLILDVSTSMSGSRIENLRPAARNFVTTVLANNTNAPQGLITISMIPYSAVVSPGSAFDTHMNINRTHSYSNCVLFESGSFNSIELDLSQPHDHVAHFDPDWFTSDSNPIGNPWCPTGNNNAIVPISTSVTDLHTAIDALTPYGNTAIDMGMKWGVGLLDPSTRTVVNQLVGQNVVPGVASGRPYEHDLEDVQKVVVLMTDGENTTQYDLKERFRTTNSYFWFDRSSNPTGELHQIPLDRISVQVNGFSTSENYWDDRFYWMRERGEYYQSDRVRKYPYGYASQWAYVQARQTGAIGINDVGDGPSYLGNIHNASWQEMYANWEYDRITYDLLWYPYNDGDIPWSAGQVWSQDNSGNWTLVYLPDYTDAFYSIDYEVVNNSQANDRLSALCARAREAGIVIYTVAFEAPADGRNALLDCASSPSHYFDVAGTDISAAFAAIASDIRALKLTR
ncbi:TadE/TadG family type IV pilus assembly protein [Pseudooctadecabacter jejudonensis]|uniref:von Willebrand factor type A domain protein n=1 Tax=Pseudooctadecabacter jejudonensis TaxID=1391910 RepID=A0A1Y5SGB3_9RHOB|nr:TadE/TadG family type IV pilus assembly protein [Pseudooctadecabacter jejudonensis]SLN40173.1 von Willebrand factor type A domain protein [Pseudooctadecabacter jejudonensis]